MITRKEFEDAVALIYTYKTQLEIELNVVKSSITHIKDIEPINKHTLLTNTNLSVRALNCIKSGCDYSEFFKLTINDLGKYSRQELCRYKNMGERSMKEIDLLCYSAGVKMKL